MAYLRQMADVYTTFLNAARLDLAVAKVAIRGVLAPEGGGNFSRGRSGPGMKIRCGSFQLPDGFDDAHARLLTVPRCVIW